jgi:hypothetical protein
MSVGYKSQSAAQCRLPKWVGLTLLVAAMLLWVPPFVAYNLKFIVSESWFNRLQLPTMLFATFALTAAVTITAAVVTRKTCGMSQVFARIALVAGIGWLAIWTVVIIISQTMM